MSRWGKTYWQLFDAGGRIVGVAFILVGGIFAVWGVSLVIDRNATIAVDGVPSSDPWTKSIVLIAGCVVGLLGILLVARRQPKSER